MLLVIKNFKLSFDYFNTADLGEENREPTHVTRATPDLQEQVQEEQSQTVNQSTQTDTEEINEENKHLESEDY